MTRDCRPERPNQRQKARQARDESSLQPAWRADADQIPHTRIRNADFQTDARAERKTAQRYFLVRIVFRKVIEASMVSRICL